MKSFETPQPQQSLQENIFKGILLDEEDASPIPFAYVSAVDFNAELTSDIDGRFQITIPQNKLVSQLELMIMPTYYEYKSVSLDLSYHEITTIYLKAIFKLQKIKEARTQQLIKPNRLKLFSWF